jgi:hypothetical protein
MFPFSCNRAFEYWPLNIGRGAGDSQALRRTAVSSVTARRRAALCSSLHWMTSKLGVLPVAGQPAPKTANAPEIPKQEHILLKWRIISRCISVHA